MADGTLVVDGVPISISILTELDVDPQIGDSVTVDASLQPDGSLVASEVEEEEEEPGTEELPEAREAEIVGTIETVNPDGSMVVNGITVFIDADAEIKGNLVEGAEVKLEGILQESGALLAQELKARGRQAAARGTDREIEGPVEEILRDSDGNIIEIVVDGQTISAETLTQIEGVLEVGVSVEIEGLEINGQFVATKVEGDEDSRRARAAEAREKGRAKAEEKAEREQEQAERRAERSRGNNSGRGANSGRSNIDSDENSSGSDSDGDSSNSGSDVDRSGSDSDGDSSGSDSDGDSSGGEFDEDSSGKDSDSDSSDRGSSDDDDDDSDDEDD